MASVASSVSTKVKLGVGGYATGEVAETMVLGGDDICHVKWLWHARRRQVIAAACLTRGDRTGSQSNKMDGCARDRTRTRRSAGVEADRQAGCSGRTNCEVRIAQDHVGECSEANGLLRPGNRVEHKS